MIRSIKRELFKAYSLTPCHARAEVAEKRDQDTEKTDCLMNKLDGTGNDGQDDRKRKG